MGGEDYGWGISTYMGTSIVRRMGSHSCLSCCSSLLLVNLQGSGRQAFDLTCIDCFLSILGM